MTIRIKDGRGIILLPFLVIFLMILCPDQGSVVVLGTTKAGHWELFCLLRFLLKKMALYVCHNCLIN